MERKFWQWRFPSHSGMYFPLFVLSNFHDFVPLTNCGLQQSVLCGSGMCIRRLCTTTHVIILYARYLPTPPLLHFLFFIPPPPTRSICSTDVCICIYIYTHTHTFCVTAAIGLTLVVRTTNWMNASVILVQDAQSAHEDKSSWRVSIYNNTL